MSITARPVQDEKKLAYGIFPLDDTFQLCQLKEYRSIGRLSKDYKIYESEELNSLLKTAREESSQDPVAVRFLLRDNNELVFAKEGGPGPTSTAPAHLQMARTYLYTTDSKEHTALQTKMYKEGGCISAGNAFFNQQNELVKINNISGDFRPPFNSLKFVLDVIFRLIRLGQIKASENIVIAKSGDDLKYTLNIQDHISTESLQIEKLTNQPVLASSRSNSSSSSSTTVDSKTMLNFDFDLEEFKKQHQKDFTSGGCFSFFNRTNLGDYKTLTKEDVLAHAKKTKTCFNSGDRTIRILKNMGYK